jgi:hypothetical protein
MCEKISLFLAPYKIQYTENSLIFDFFRDIRIIHNNLKN